MDLHEREAKELLRDMRWKAIEDMRNMGWKAIEDKKSCLIELVNQQIEPNPDDFILFFQCLTIVIGRV